MRTPSPHPQRRATDRRAPRWRRGAAWGPALVGIFALALLLGTGLQQLSHNTKKLDVTSQKADAALAAVDQLASAAPGSTVTVTIPPSEPGGQPMTAVVTVVQSATPTAAPDSGSQPVPTLTRTPGATASVSPMPLPSHADASASAPVDNPGITPSVCVAAVIAGCVKLS